MKSTMFVSNVIVTEKQRQSTKEYFTIRPWERGKVTGLWPGNGVWSLVSGHGNGLWSLVSGQGNGLWPLVSGHGNGLWSLVSGQYWPHFRNRAITRESSRSQEWQKGNRCKQDQVGQRCVLFEWTSFMNECFYEWRYFYEWMSFVNE